MTPVPCDIIAGGWCTTHRGMLLPMFGVCDVAKDSQVTRGVTLKESMEAAQKAHPEWFDHWGEGAPPQMDMRQWLSHSQRLQSETFGGDPGLLSGEDRAEYVRRMVLGLIKEATEVLDEVGWKWWSNRNHFNREKYLEELVDVMHFVGALAVAANCTDEEWAQMYAVKSEINRTRQKDGY